MTDIYSIGEMVIDFVPGSEPDSYIKNAGGAPANVAIAASRNGLSAALCCKVGEDDFGRFLMNTLRENRVGIAGHPFCKEAVTTMAFVTLGSDGERSFTFARRPGADMFLSVADVREEDITDAVIVHGGSCSLSAASAAAATVRALTLGHDMGRLVSFDVNYRNLMWQDRREECAAAVMDILDRVDLLKISEEELSMFGGRENLPALMRDKNIAAVILTLGASGSEGYLDDEVIPVPARVVRAVDTTGAGDSFWGGFLSCLRLQGIERRTDLTAERIRKAMEYGTICSSLCVQKKGALSSLPTKKEVMEVAGYME